MINGNEIDTHLFIEIIMSVQGVTLISQHEFDGEIIEHYLGVNGNKIQLCVTDEFITRKIAHAYLRQLGLTHLIDNV